MVDVAYMRVCILNECVGYFLVYRNNNLLARGFLSGHVDARLRFVLATIDDLLDLINLVVLEFWEHLFDLESVHCCIRVLGFKRSHMPKLLLNPRTLIQQ